MSDSAHDFPVGSAHEITPAKESADALLPTASKAISPEHSPIRSDVDIPSDLVRFARQVKSARNDRAVMFDPTLFGEPAWDMLLALYIAEGEGYRLKVNEICFESGCPETTALRWLIKLEELHLVRRRQNPLDARSSFVEIEAEAVSHMTTYLLKIR